MNAPNENEATDVDYERRRPLHEVVLRLDQLWDRTRRRHRGGIRRITVEPYLAHGSQDLVIARGRVFGGTPVHSAAGIEPVWRRIRRGLRRFLTDELDGIGIEARLGDATGVDVTDEEGYYHIELVDHGLSGDRLIHRVELTVRHPPPGADVTIGAGRAHVPTSRARRLIVSDVDDTVLATDATRTLRMLVTTLTGSAWTRRGFPGTPELYSGLARGHGIDDNAFVYVSSSPWNLHGFLAAFLQRTGLPVGPLFLRDLGVDETTFIHGHHDDHKLGTIDQLLDMHSLPIVLIGDTGQRDPEIYRAVVEKHPQRVDAVLFRHLASEARAAEVRELFDNVDVPMALAADTLGLAEAAESNRLIPDGWTARVAEAADSLRSR